MNGYDNKRPKTDWKVLLCTRIIITEPSMVPASVRASRFGSVELKL